MQKFTLRIYIVLAFISFLNLSAFAGSIGSDQLLLEANQLLREYKDCEALERFEQVLEKEPNHIEALCKASVLCGRIGNRFSDDTRKGVYFQKAQDFAKKALYTDSLNAETNYVMAMALSISSQIANLKERMRIINEVKTYTDRALQYNPNHAGAWHVLGRWSFKVANLTFAEKAASKLYTSSVPPTATNEQAMQALQHAIYLSPSNLTYYYDLAQIQKEVNQKDACIQTLQKALDQKLVTAEDLELSRKCKVLLHQILRV